MKKIKILFNNIYHYVDQQISLKFFLIISFNKYNINKFSIRNKKIELSV